MSTIPAGFGQVTFTFNGSGVPTGAAVTLGFEVGGGVNAAIAATDFKTNWQTNMMPPLVQNTGLASVLVKLGPNDTGPSAIVASTVAGSDLSAQAPANVAYLIHKTTNEGGRRGRGRMYLPGVDETEVDQGGNVSAGKVTALQAAINAFHTQAIADGCVPYLLHEPEQVWVLVNGQPKRQSVGAAPAPTEIQTFPVATVVATQRRRQRR